jgi:hypothetical protein
VAASQIAVTPSGALTSDVQTSLQALDTGKAPLSHSQLSSTISDSTAAGRALLTAADVPTQQTLLGMTVLGFQPADVKETACPVLQTGWYCCDGSNKNRVTDAALFNAITIQQSGVLTSASAVVTGLTDTSNMSPGMPMSAAAGGVPANTVVQSVDSSTQITMSANATASTTTALVFAALRRRRRLDHLWPAEPLLRRGRPRQCQRQRRERDAGLDVDQHHQWQSDRNRGVCDRPVRRMHVSHPKVPFGTTISAISGTTITLSANATATASSAARFSPVFDAQTLGQKVGAISHSTTLATANLPPYTPSGSITINPIGLSPSVAQNPASSVPSANTTGGTTSITGSFTGTAQGGALKIVARGAEKEDKAATTADAPRPIAFRQPPLLF